MAVASYDQLNGMLYNFALRGSTEILNLKNGWLINDNDAAVLL